MKNARNNRRSFLTEVDNFKCNSYVKTSIQKEHEEVLDSVTKAKDFETYLKKESLNLIEYVANTYYKRPGKFKEEILAYHDFTDAKPIDLTYTYTVGGDYGEQDIAPSVITSYSIHYTKLYDTSQETRKSLWIYNFCSMAFSTGKY